MKLNPLQISCAINIALVALWGVGTLYKTGHSVPHAWVSGQGISREDFNNIKMRLDANGQGILVQIGSRPGPRKSIKSLNVYEVLWTNDENEIHIYHTDKNYLKRGRLLGAASITGYRQLEVVFTGPRFKNFPAKANFKSIA